MWYARRNDFSPFSTETALAPQPISLHHPHAWNLIANCVFWWVAGKHVEGLLCASLLKQREKYQKGQRKEYGGGGEREVDRVRIQENKAQEQKKCY